MIFCEILMYVKHPQKFLKNHTYNVKILTLRHFALREGGKTADWFGWPWVTRLLAVYQSTISVHWLAACSGCHHRRSMMKVVGLVCKIVILIPIWEKKSRFQSRSWKIPNLV